MVLPLQVSARGTTVTDMMRALIEQHAAKLEQFHDRMTACRVVVNAQHAHMGRTTLYNVRIDLTVPGEEIVVRRKIQPDLLSAVQDAFDAAGRQLQDFVGRQRQESAGRATPSRGVVAALHLFEGYGFVRTEDGREIYFHRNSVLDGAFVRLDVGSAVRFAEEEGAEGPQASSVALAAGNA